MPLTLSLPLPRNASAPERARTELRRRLADQVPADTLRDVELVVSELVTNAVLHGAGTLVLRLELDDDGCIQGDVVDEGGGFEYELRQEGFEQVGGRGLFLVDRLTDRWGVHEGTTHVWFAVQVPSDRAADAEPGPELGYPGEDSLPGR
jgi:anti-sigma regulatory factor (Ser/Thr protein kinase)